MAGLWRSNKFERAFKRRCISLLSLGGDKPYKLFNESLPRRRLPPMIFGSVPPPSSSPEWSEQDFRRIPESNSHEECTAPCLLCSDNSLLESDMWPYGWLSSSVEDVDNLCSRYSVSSSRFIEKCWCTTRFTAIADSAKADNSRAELFRLKLSNKWK